MIRVNLESPCAGAVSALVPPLLRPLVERALRLRNRVYAIDCMRDCLRRGEAPYASHVLFDAAGVLRDHVKGERAQGMACGDAWSVLADYHAFYVDHGMSPGMLRRWDECMQHGYTAVKRYLYRKGHNSDGSVTTN